MMTTRLPDKKSAKIASRQETVDLTRPGDIAAFATELKELIVQNKLYTDIRGKNYVNVEGWQIAGAFTGAYPIVEKVESLSEGTFYKYRAEVSLRDKEGAKVGYGVAICTNRENGKKAFDEYAVASMAQTRAVGKAYRMKLGWLLKIAGYETTPAEEMDAVEAQVVSENSTGESRLDFDELREELRAINSEAELLKHFNQIKRTHDLTDKQLSAVKDIYAQRKSIIRLVNRGTPPEVAEVSKKAASFQMAAEEGLRDPDAEGMARREQEESVADKIVNTQRELAHLRATGND